MDLGFNSQNAGNNLYGQTVGGHSVTSAIKLASAQSGVDFSYLLKKADVESSLDPTAKASSSSATGLFQFVEQTWLRVVKAYGDKYGLGDVADRITIGSDGIARVNDKGTRLAILNLRKDPDVASQMAAELTNENRETLQTKVGGKIGSTELYLAHFLGANGASTFLKQMRANPNAAAADYLPTAAAANPSVFYDKEGNARTLKAIYANFARKFEDNGSSGAPMQVASLAPVASKIDLSSQMNATVLRTKATSLSVAQATGNSYIDTMMLAQAGIGDMSMASMDALFGHASEASRRRGGVSAYSNLT